MRQRGISSIKFYSIWLCCEWLEINSSKTLAMCLWHPEWPTRRKHFTMAFDKILHWIEFSQQPSWRCQISFERLMWTCELAFISEPTKNFRIRSSLKDLHLILLSLSLNVWNSIPTFKNHVFNIDTRHLSRTGKHNAMEVVLPLPLASDLRPLNENDPRATQSRLKFDRN